MLLSFLRDVTSQNSKLHSWKFKSLKFSIASIKFQKGLVAICEDIIVKSSKHLWNLSLLEVTHYIHSIVYTIHVRSTYCDLVLTIEDWKLHGNHPLVVVGLLEHENKMSVLNFVLRRTQLHNLPIKSKVRLNYSIKPHPSCTCVGATYIPYRPEEIFSSYHILSAHSRGRQA